MSGYENRIADLCDDLRTELARDNPDLRRIREIKDAQAAAQRKYDAAWEAAHAASPVMIDLDDETGVIYTLTVAMGGGRSRTYARPGDPGYDHALRAILAYREGEAAARRDAKAAALTYLGLPVDTPAQVIVYDHYVMVHPNGSRRIGVRVDRPGLQCRTIDYGTVTRRM